MSNTISVLSTGGTIASTSGTNGASPSMSGEDLISAVPDLAEYATIEVREISQRPSFDMDMETMERIGREARGALANGADAIIVTHGTDTMEESAYYLDLTLQLDAPVVFTGAQRRPDEVSPDGPANILTAVRMATHQRIRRHGGVYIAFDETLHAARDVTKHHTAALDTFTSFEKGPVATQTREDIRLYRRPMSYSADLAVTSPSVDVRIVNSAVGVDGRLIDMSIEDGADGIILDGTGLGNTTKAIGESVERTIDMGVPVVVTSRCPAGTTAPVYGSGGGGRTLADHGAIHGDDLPAHKARLKLMLLLAADTARHELEGYFEGYRDPDFIR